MLLPLCRECRMRFFDYVSLTSGRRCRICGKELISENGTCLSCREKNAASHIFRIYPLFSYRLWNKAVLFEWKTMNVRVLSPFLASVVHKAVCEIEGERDGSPIPIVPVPPRPNKIKVKGWDQIDELCRFLNGFYSHKIMPLLARNSVQQQKKLGRLQRFESIKSAYSCAPKKELDKLLSRGIPEEVILLDDVMTTGATAEKCAALLQEIGIYKVHVLTLFTVDG
ncbi:ComF family protein [Treponema parvum]|uniref:ComF family protein n=1 Tax=Treponema parvum TaxID=138851 RepID=A0A975F3I8_9SPIR|nr:ComF family protein [Treponema parvum]QTQ13705.1 ComF family protein [Treponema parvum]